MNVDVRMAALHLFRQRYGVAADPEIYPERWQEALDDAADYIAEEN
jgi:hypothetical protein